MDDAYDYDLPDDVQQTSRISEMAQTLYGKMMKIKEDVSFDEMLAPRALFFASADLIGVVERKEKELEEKPFDPAAMSDADLERRLLERANLLIRRFAAEEARGPTPALQFLAEFQQARVQPQKD